MVNIQFTIPVKDKSTYKLAQDIISQLKRSKIDVDAASEKLTDYMLDSEIAEYEKKVAELKVLKEERAK